MMKILVFTDRSPGSPDPFSQLLWNQLASWTDVQNEVIVITHNHTDEDGQSTPRRLQVLKPWKGWGAQNLPKLLYLLQAHKPDIIHLVEPAEKKWSDPLHVLHAIPMLSAVHPRPRISVQLFSQAPACWGKLAQGWAQAADQVFISGPAAREHLRGTVIETPFIFDSETEQRPSHWITGWAKEFVFIPAPLEEFKTLPLLLTTLERRLSTQPNLQVILTVKDRVLKDKVARDLRASALLNRSALLEDFDQWSNWRWAFENARTLIFDGLDPGSPYQTLIAQWSQKDAERAMKENFWSRAFQTQA